MSTDLHCWENGPSFCRRTGKQIENEFGMCGEHYYDEPACEVGTTCMLLRDHAGPHQWTRDDHIGVEFSNA